MAKKTRSSKKHEEDFSNEASAPVIHEDTGDNAVIERCAVVADHYAKFSALAKQIGSEIRKLKS